MEGIPAQATSARPTFGVAGGLAIPAGGSFGSSFKSGYDIAAFLGLRSASLPFRSKEWAEAYAADHPQCLMGRLYLDFLRREIVRVMGDL